MLTRFNQWWCGLWYGHMDIRMLEPKRGLYLECMNCGRVTPGWVLPAVRLPQERRS